MRLKRKMTEAEFAAAILHLRNPRPTALKIAHADLVRGVPQDEIARLHGRTKSSVSQVSRRVWLGFLKNRGLKEISVILPRVRLFTVQQWSREAMESINK